MAKDTKKYDAIVVGGGHNGLVNGCYLAKAGLKTLIIERRGFVGGAAITEELHPGFHFTTFSYALSLLRPDIIHELELVKHGFMPILMPSSFAPMENGDYLLLGQDRDENIKEITAALAARRRRDGPLRARRRAGLPADQAAARQGAAEHLRQVSRGPRRPGRAGLAPRWGGAEGAPRPGAADDRQRRRLPRRLLRERHPQGLHRLGGHHRHQGRADVAGVRPGPALPLDGRARRPLRRVGVPQGWQRRVHAGACPRGPGVRGRDPARLAGRHGDHQGGQGCRRGAGRRHRAQREHRGVRARPAAHVHRAGRAPRAARRARRQHQPDAVPGHVGKGQLRSRRPAEVPRARRPLRPVPRLRQHRAVDGVPRASLRRCQVRLVQLAALHRHGHPVDRRPRHGATRQARHELLHPVRARTT